MIRTPRNFKTRLLLLGFGVFTLTAQAAISPEPMKLSTILQKLNSQGYTNISDIEREDGIIIVEGSTKKGVNYELHLDPATGDILKNQQHIKTRYSALDIAKKIEAKGYKTIDEIEFDEGVYKVKASTKDGKEVELHVDPNTGEAAQAD